MLAKAALPSDEGAEFLANGRSAQCAADAEQQRGAEESPRLPFCRLRGWISALTGRRLDQRLYLAAGVARRCTAATWARGCSFGCWEIRRLCPVLRGAARYLRCRSIDLCRIDELDAELLQRARQQPRDMHLGDTEALRDFRLRQLTEESQHQNRALTFGKHVQQWP
jgi:hypothetical protein